MASGFPNYIDRIASSKIATYDYTDLVSGLGYQDFYPVVSGDDAAETYHLTTNSSEVSFNADVIASGAGGGSVEYNFNTSTFNQPRTVNGTAIFTGWLEGDGGTSTVTVTFVLYRVDSGSAEHQIGTTDVDIDAGIGSSGVYINVRFSCTETTIAIGETLRLSITISTDNLRGIIGSDPADNAGTWIDPATAGSTISKISIPFRIR